MSNELQSISSKLDLKGQVFDSVQAAFDSAKKMANSDVNIFKETGNNMFTSYLKISPERRGSRGQLGLAC